MPPSTVSLRQYCAAASCALVLPIAALSARGTGLGAAIGTVPAVIYYNVCRRCALPSPAEAGRAAYGKAAVPLELLHALAMLVLAALLSAQTGTLFPETAGLPWAGLGVLALATAAANKGVAVVLRCGAVLLVPLAAICAAVLLLALPGANPEWLAPTPNLPAAGVTLLLLLLPTIGAYFVPSIRVKNAKPTRWVLGAGIAACAAAVTAAVCLSPELAAAPMSFYTLARSVSIFGVMLRLESFVSGALTASAFVGMALLLGAASCAARVLRLPIWGFGAAAALLSLLPDGFLSSAAVPAAIFCAGFPIVTQAIVACKKPEKKSEFFEKNS